MHLEESRHEVQQHVLLQVEEPHQGAVDQDDDPYFQVFSEADEYNLHENEDPYTRVKDAHKK